MMLAGDRLRVALTTVHIPLRRVHEELTPTRLHDTLRTTASEMQRRFDIGRPRIAVCALNPHAGELGIMGTEEGDVIGPVVQQVQESLGEEVDFIGPLAADTLFAKFQGDAQPYDAVVCMYHDQALIPLKLLHFGTSANLTLGLPIIRTSVDHGTAYDIAGQGIADPGSMRYALTLAIELDRRAA